MNATFVQLSTALFLFGFSIELSFIHQANLSVFLSNVLLSAVIITKGSTWIRPYPEGVICA